MYDPILLTLDGSKLSEVAVPHAAALAKEFHARVVILRVVSPVIGPDDFAYGPNPYTYQHLMEAEEKASQEYVAQQAAELAAQGIDAEGVTRVGDPAGTVVDFATERGAKLLILATHGRSGLARWVFGSVADRVLRSAPAPVLLVRAGQPVR
jgi:nucleotide-binding universal stress UspA family protein